MGVKKNRKEKAPEKDGADLAGGRMLTQDAPLVDIDSVTPHPGNPRFGDVETIKQSILAHGFYGALLVQRSTGFILIGNHRWKAAKELGYRKLPMMFVDLDDDQAQRLLVMDNRASDLATYDYSRLANLLLTFQQSTTVFQGTGFDPITAQAVFRAAGFHAAPPAEFAAVDPNAATQFRCPHCHFEWNGSPR
jgi:hypothetical protein